MAFIAMNAKDHKDLKVIDKIDVALAENQHMLPVVAHEFAAASTEYPIVFIKHEEAGLLQPIVMLGLEPGENLFIKDGAWQGNYIPGALTSSPLRLMPSENDQTKLIVAYNDQSHLISKEDGQAIFNDDGSESEYFEARKKGLIQYLEHTSVTANFVKALTDMDLFIERTMEIMVDGQKREIGGVSLIDEDKLRELSDEKFIELRKAGFLHVIYAHLISMNHVNRLIHLKMQAAA